MPRKELTQAEYDARMKKRLARIQRKQSGGNSNRRGNDFEEFVCVCELMRLASTAVAGGTTNVYVCRQWPNEVDDVYIRVDNLSRFLQVKSGAKVSWSFDIVHDFLDAHQRTADRSERSFELWFGSRRNAEIMARNAVSASHMVQPPNPLTFIRFYSIEMDWMKSPHLQAQICEWIDDIALTGYQDDLFLATYWHIMSGFKAMDCKGTLSEIFDMIASISHHSTVTFSEPGDSHPFREWLIDELNNIPELLFAEEGGKLKVTLPEECCIEPTCYVYAWVDVYDILIPAPPVSADEFFRIVKSAKH